MIHKVKGSWIFSNKYLLTNIEHTTTDDNRLLSLRSRRGAGGILFSGCPYTFTPYSQFWSSRKLLIKSEIRNVSHVRRFLQNWGKRKRRGKKWRREESCGRVSGQTPFTSIQLNKHVNMQYLKEHGTINEMIRNQTFFSIHVIRLTRFQISNIVFYLIDI